MADNGEELLVAQRFRVGVTADFRTNLPGVIEPALTQVLGPQSHVGYEFLPELKRVMAADQLIDYDAVISAGVHYSAESFLSAERLAVIARWGVGYDMIDVPACTRSDVLVAITTNAVRRPVAEAIVTLMLALARKLPSKDELTRTGRWDQRASLVGVGLRGKTVGSVGVGNIGADMFRLLRPFGLGRKLAYDPYVDRAVVNDSGVELVDLPALFRLCDFVAINCPLTSDTRGMIDAGLLSLMKSSAYLINTARGAIVKQADLTAALTQNRIAGAGLDVFEVEPLPADDPLTRLDNVILAPHSLAFTDNMYRETGAEACQNVLAVLSGEMPPHAANPEVAERPGFQAKLRSMRQRWGVLSPD